MPVPAGILILHLLQVAFLHSHPRRQDLKPAGISISGGSYCAVIKQQLIANRVLLCLGLMRGEKINLVTTN